MVKLYGKVGDSEFPNLEITAAKREDGTFEVTGYSLLPPRDETPVCHWCGGTLASDHDQFDDGTWGCGPVSHNPDRKPVPRWRYEKAQRILDGLDD